MNQSPITVNFGSQRDGYVFGASVITTYPLAGIR